MSTHFAKTASTLYTTTGSGKSKRIRFHNGKSSEKVASDMDMTTTMSPARLSRVLNGKGSFTREQLTAFCTALELSEGERQALHDALLRDYGERAGFSLSVTSDPFVVNMLVTNVELLRAAINDGHFDYAMELLRELGKTRAGLEARGDDVAPLLRIAVLMEGERELLLHALARTRTSDDFVIALPDDEEQKDRIDEAIEDSGLSQQAREVARWRYLEERDVEEIADRVEMTDEAVLAWLDEIHGVLLQRLTRDPE